MNTDTTEAAAKAPASSAAPARRENVLRRLYHWVLGWAETPYGTPALAVISFTESSFFPIPPDVLQIALSVSKPKRSYYYAAVSAVASVAGAAFGFLLGYAFWSVIGGFFLAAIPGFSRENFEHVGKLYEANAFLAIVGAAFTPIPFKVFTVTAGVFHEYVSLGVLLAASAVGRSLRFFMVATVIYFFGKQAKELLERYFEVATLVLFVLAVLGFVFIKVIL